MREHEQLSDDELVIRYGKLYFQSVTDPAFTDHRTLNSMYEEMQTRRKQPGGHQCLAERRIQPIPESERSPHDEKTLAADKVEIALVGGVEGPSLYIADYRVTGHKPWGGGTIRERWTVEKSRILRALGLEEDNRPRLPSGFARHEKLSTQIREAVTKVVYGIEVGDDGLGIEAAHNALSGHPDRAGARALEEVFIGDLILAVGEVLTREDQ